MSKSTHSDYVILCKTLAAGAEGGMLLCAEVSVYLYPVPFPLLRDRNPQCSLPGHSWLGVQNTLQMCAGAALREALWLLCMRFTNN